MDQDHVPRVIRCRSTPAINCLFKRLSDQIKWPRQRSDSPLGADVTSAPGVFVRVDKVTEKVSFSWSGKSSTSNVKKKVILKKKKKTAVSRRPNYSGLAVWVKIRMRVVGLLTNWLQISLCNTFPLLWLKTWLPARLFQQLPTLLSHGDDDEVSCLSLQQWDSNLSARQMRAVGPVRRNSPRILQLLIGLGDLPVAVDHLHQQPAGQEDEQHIHHDLWVECRGVFGGCGAQAITGRAGDDVLFSNVFQHLKSCSFLSVYPFTRLTTLLLMYVQLWQPLPTGITV